MIVTEWDLALNGHKPKHGYKYELKKTNIFCYAIFWHTKLLSLPKIKKQKARPPFVQSIKTLLVRHKNYFIMKKIKMLPLIAIVFLMNSCSSNQKKIQDKWWYEKTNYGSDIIMFTSKGKSVNINDNRTYDYQITDNEISLIISEKKTEKIKIENLTEEELILAVDKNKREYRIAKQTDFIVGRWKTMIKGDKVNLRFKKNGDWEMGRSYSTESEGIYVFSANKLKIGDEAYNYKFSEDYMTLELTGKENLTLIRKI